MFICDICFKNQILICAKLTIGWALFPPLRFALLNDKYIYALTSLGFDACSILLHLDEIVFKLELIDNYFLLYLYWAFAVLFLDLAAITILLAEKVVRVVISLH